MTKQAWTALASWGWGVADHTVRLQPSFSRKHPACMSHHSTLERAFLRAATTNSIAIGSVVLRTGWHERSSQMPVFVVLPTNNEWWKGILSPGLGSRGEKVLYTWVHAPLCLPATHPQVWVRWGDSFTTLPPPESCLGAGQLPTFPFPTP